jgi:hypothetical protein
MESQRLRRIPCVGRQAGHDPRHLGRQRDPSTPSGSRPQPAASLFRPGPQLTELGLVLPVRTVHELEVADRQRGRRRHLRQAGATAARRSHAGRVTWQMRASAACAVRRSSLARYRRSTARRWGSVAKTSRPERGRAGFGGEYAATILRAAHVRRHRPRCRDSRGSRFGEAAPRSPRAHCVADQSVGHVQSSVRSSTSPRSSSSVSAAR